MTELFGLDFTQTIADAFQGQLEAGTLTRVTPGTRTPGSLAAGSNPTTTAHTFEGTLTRGSVRFTGGVMLDGTFVLVILGSVSPVAIPRPGDRISMGDLTAAEVLKEIERDPGGATSWIQIKE